MKALDRKLLRDLWSMKGQALAIALVISSGVATFIMSISTLDSLKLTQATFYRDYRFAEVFASLKRAPDSLKSRIQEISGVQQVETRVLAAANLEIADYPDPVSAQIVSLQDDGTSLLNQLHFRQGRSVAAGRDNEVVISDAFAQAHGFHPGDHLYAVINGRRKRLQVVGVALSPEFVYQLQPGSFIPDFKSYGVLWMARTPLSNAYDMEGAFNDVSVTLLAGTRPEAVIERIDDLLKRYGGLGAYSRQNQTSHRYLSEEFRQLTQMATIFPIIFLSVAAFLLNVVVTRLIATQREQVAILKAFGYPNGAVVAHFLKLVILVVLLGVAGGIFFGIWLGQGLSRMYMDFYRFPFLVYHLRPSVAFTAALVSSAAAMLGTVYSVARAALEPPAQAMQPASPPRYRTTFLERLGLGSFLSQPTRMIVRNLERRPVKALLTIVGIAFACAILVVGGFFGDAIDYMVAIQFRLAQRDDITVTFVEPTSRKALYSLSGLSGVEHAEGFRSVPVRFRFRHHSYRTSIQGLPDGSELRHLLDTNLQRVPLPGEGLLMTDHLAEILQVQPGDLLTVEVLEGSRPVLRVPVTALVKEYVGVSGYMQLEALNSLMQEGHALSGAYLAVDPLSRQQVYSELKQMPRVAGSSVRETALKNFYETMAKQILTFALVNTILAGTIAFGVVYNSARIAFSERSRELASLRVLGFTRGEISYILLGEQALLTVAALPIGCLIGWGLCHTMISGLQTDLFRIPLVIEPGTYSSAATVVVVSSLISALMVRRKLDHLDLIAVLKTKE
ncbi:MAG: ABC transporter permease [Acidobacteriota bacterium]